MNNNVNYYKKKSASGERNELLPPGGGDVLLSEFQLPENFALEPRSVAFFTYER
jgi:hypothetical protein